VADITSGLSHPTPRLRYSYATCFGTHGAIIRRYNI
jgi:hypothetical protein